MLSTAAFALALVASTFASGTQFGTHGWDPAQATQESATMQAGRARLRAQDFAAAIELFEQAAQDEPENARAWYMLGFALHASGDLDVALDVHARAAEFELVRANASYNAGCASARLGRTDEAFEWLTKAVDAGFGNIGRLTTDGDLASLRSDPRFQKLLPIGRELSFVEDVDVLIELRGESAGDRYGWIGRNAGDVDGDGIADMLLSAPFRNVGGPAAGSIYVHSGASGELLWRADGKPGAQLGIGIEGVGDLDGDGVPDQLAGASGAFGTGAAYAYSGKDGELLFEWKGEGQGDQFGRKVSGAGDMNGDGHADVIIGAPYNDGSGRDAGRAYVYSGKDGALLHRLDGEAPGDLFGRAVDAHSSDDIKLLIIGASDAGPDKRGRVHVYRVEAEAAAEHFRIEGRPGDKELGMMFVSAVGDVNGDGVVDVYASDWGSNGDGLPGCGRIYVHSGKDGALLHALVGETQGEGFGIGTSEAGDVDGDGCDDLLVGAWQHGVGAPGGGKCTLFSGKTGAVLATYTCQVPGETFGFDTTTLGDVNGDGVPDFLITNADSFVKGPQSGRVVVIAGPKPSK